MKYKCMKCFLCDYDRRGSVIVGTTLAHPIGKSQYVSKKLWARRTNFSAWSCNKVLVSRYDVTWALPGKICDRKASVVPMILFAFKHKIATRFSYHGMTWLELSPAKYATLKPVLSPWCYSLHAWDCNKVLLSRHNATRALPGKICEIEAIVLPIVWY